MKKEYITPETLLHSLQLQQIIANSPLRTNEDGDLIDGTLQDEGAQGPGLSRRRRNQWDEWEDEEEEYY